MNLVFKADYNYYDRNIYDKHIQKYYDDIGISRNYVEHNGEYRITNTDNIEYFVIELSPRQDIIWGDIKRNVAQVIDFLSDFPEIKEMKIYFSGNRNFYIWCFLKYYQDKYKILEMWEKILYEKFRDIHIVNSFVAPYNINRNTGLCCVEVDDLENFRKADASIDKVYKKVTKKEFPWKIASTQPLVSNPPYRGNLLDYLKKKNIVKKVKEKLAKH